MIKKPKLGDIVWYIDCDNRYNLCKRCGGITDIFCKSEIEIGDKVARRIRVVRRAKRVEADARRIRRGSDPFVRAVTL
jgi:hypothetical protein